jgi:hypothetical protein
MAGANCYLCKHMHGWTSFDRDNEPLIPLSYPRIGQDSRKCSEPDRAFARSALYLVER